MKYSLSSENFNIYKQVNVMNLSSIIRMLSNGSETHSSITFSISVYCLKTIDAFFFLYTNFILFLTCSWFKMLCQSLLYSKVVQLYIYIYTFFFMFFSTVVYHRILNIVPCAVNRTVLFIHPTYNSLHPLTPNSQSSPSPFSPTWQPQVCSLCLWVCFCFVDRFICAIF